MYTSVAHAAEPVDFAGERVTIMVPYKEGGASDTFARTFARVLGGHLPGNPSIIVQNLPGAGAIAGTNRFEREAEPDGLTLLATSTSTLLNFVTNADGADYEPKNWLPIIVTPQGAVSYVRSETGITADMDLAQKVQAVKDFDLVYGDSSPTGGPLRFLLTLDMLGINPKTVWGLAGGGPRRQAFQRNEFHINYESSLSYIKRGIPMVEEGIAVPFFAMGMIGADSEIIRDPLFPELPSFMELYAASHGGEMPSGLELDAWRKLFIIGTIFNKALFLPEGTPDEIVDAYTDAITATVNDADFLENGGAALTNYDPIIGLSSKPLLAEAVGITPETFDFLDRFLQENHSVSLNR